jgi:hypothetical protein
VRPFRQALLLIHSRIRQTDAKHSSLTESTMSDPTSCDTEKEPSPNQGSSPFTNQCRVLPELVEEILFYALSQEIHHTLVSCSSFVIHAEQIKRRSASQSLNESSEEEEMRNRASSEVHKSMNFPSISGFLSVSRTFRSIIQRILITIVESRLVLCNSTSILLLTGISESPPTYPSQHI